ncbi:MAG TPA: hypothetical protein VN577_14630 [Terriglobales bacterium]|nr:hypothetical protein [Terriglobales bacterium]
MTQVDRWVSGTIYLSTRMAYDATGRVTSVIDPRNNPAYATTYTYTDNFFNDNGQNPPTATSPATTHAYPTSITRPLIGTETYGYYYGTGKQALFTDQNSN